MKYFILLLVYSTNIFAGELSLSSFRSSYEKKLNDFKSSMTTKEMLENASELEKWTEKSLQEVVKSIEGNKEGAQLQQKWEDYRQLSFTAIDLKFKKENASIAPVNVTLARAEIMAAHVQNLLLLYSK